MIIKCDTAMKHSKRKKRRGNEGWYCNKDCKHCICAMVKLNDGTWEHLRIGRDGEVIISQRMGEPDDK